jgi:predicted HTH domain antitoxin
MQLSVDIPNSTQFTLNENIDNIGNLLKLNTALMLFKNAKFSIEQAAKFASLSLYDFMLECKKNNISILEYDSQDLNNELNILKNL